MFPFAPKFLKKEERGNEIKVTKSSASAMKKKRIRDSPSSSRSSNTAIPHAPSAPDAGASGGGDVDIVRLSGAEDGSMSSIHGSATSLSCLLVFNDTCIRYVSGSCKMTLLRGSASINGYSLPLNECVDSIHFPCWMPAARLCAGAASSKKKQKSGKSEKASSSPFSTIASFLEKNGKLDYFENMKNCRGDKSMDKTDKKDKAANIDTMIPTTEVHMLDASACVVLLQGLTRAQQEWMVAAEEQRFGRSNCANGGSTGASRGGVQLPREGDIVSVESAGVGDAYALRRLGIESTFLPQSWAAAVDEMVHPSKSHSIVDEGPAVVSQQNQRNQRNQQNQQNRSSGSTMSEHLNTCTDSVKGLFCGAKGVGKSTCLRYAVNRLLSETSSLGTGTGGDGGKHKAVCVLDCDVGQSEYTTPGQVSLHIITAPTLSAPHLNVRKPYLGYFFGDISPKQVCRPDYLSCYKAIV